MSKVNARLLQTVDADREYTLSERIQLAEASVAALRGNFLIWARDDLERIDCAFVQAKIDSGSKLQALSVIRGIAHNIKGQGGTFGLDALSTAAGDLNFFLIDFDCDTDLSQVECLISTLRQEFSCAQS